MTIEAHSDHVRTLCTHPFPFFNTISGLDFPEGAASACISRIMQSVKHCERAVVWHLSPRNNTPEINRLLNKAGCFKTADESALAIDLAELPCERALPTGVTMAEVETPEQLLIWSKTMAVPHQIPAAVVTPWTELHEAAGYGKQSNRWHHFIAFHCGQPVGTSSLFLGAGIAYMANIAVLKSFQKQGIGRAISGWTLSKATEHGFRVAAVSGSAMGDALYRSLGFREYARSAMYLWLPE